MTTALEPGVERAASWRLLSLGFAPPREETLGEIEALAEALLEGDEGTAAADVLDAIRSEGIDALGSRYQRLFGGSVLVAPYEGSYEIDPIRQGRQMADVAAFYRAFGAEAHGPAAERPDHAGCELEFLAFLELRRLTAVGAGDEDGAQLVEEIAETFLRDHVGRWLPTFFVRVYETAEHAPFYRALAAFGARAVDEELARRGIEPTPLPQRPSRSSIEGDSFECGGPAPTS
ncbi:MAG TPA: molecular chaperone TorD family protein [Gaiellaceae bacterium]|nr:molecular chaperone TorD family protein [Gaiellaceae bacterium]